jgi:hypothetical protein
MTAVLSAYKGETVSVDVGEGGKPDLYYTMTTYNPQSKWDGYSVGGRWSGYFVHRADSDRDRRLVTGEKSWANEGKPRELFHCDGGPRELLDFAAQRDAAGIRAAEQYDKWAALTEGLPEGQSWMSFLERYEAAPDAYPIDRARDDYHAQPAYRAASASEDFRWFDDVIGYFAHSRDEHIAAARNSAVPGYALLALDGTWVGPGEMGWFGMSSDTESSRALYHEQANAYLDTLPGDAIIVAVDCHI